jgi:hypothetical protein
MIFQHFVQLLSQMSLHKYTEALEMQLKVQFLKRMFLQN